MAEQVSIDTKQHIRLLALTPRRRNAFAASLIKRIYQKTRECTFLPRELEWLEDNRYIIARAQNALDRELSTPQWNTSKHYKKLFALCENVFLDAFKAQRQIDEKYLEEKFEKARLNLRECSASSAALRLTVLCFLAGLASQFEANAENAQKGNRREDKTLSSVASFVITSLRCLENIDFDKFCARISPIERIYANDPAGAYSEMDEATRALYRTSTAQLARRARLGESECASLVLRLAGEGKSERKKHVGFYLFERPLGKRKRRFSPVLYLILAVLIPALVCIMLLASGFGIWTIFAFALLVQLQTNLQNPVFQRFLHGHRALSMEPVSAFPDDARTICVIAALVCSEREAKIMYKRLENYYLAAKGGENLLFGLLLDLPEAQTLTAKDDCKIIAAAKAEVDKLNKKYGGFLLFTRSREYSSSENKYIAGERKRGALEQLIALVGGLNSSISAYGAQIPKNVRYIVTLDADTAPAVGALSQCAAVMRHPLNHPEIKNGRVKNGHGILQPRLCTALGGESDFARIWTGCGGSDIYGAAASDLYQDLLGETNFTGKGMIDVNAYLSVLYDKLPKERILSHDLIEGAYMRAIYSGQTEFFEGFPQSPQSFFSREHRWIRGDWQNIPFIARYISDTGGKRENVLAVHAKLRIFSNILRSLQPVFTILFIFLSLSGILPIYALLLSTAQFVSPIMTCTIAPREQYRWHIKSSFDRTLSCAAMQFVFLPKAAWTTLDAAVRSIWRTGVSHKHMLQWRTSNQSEKSKFGFISALYAFIPCIITAVALLLLPDKGFFIMLLRVITALLWLSSPFAAMCLSRVRKEKKDPLKPEQQEWIRKQCALMYGYFRDNIGEDTCNLPPDNVQLRPSRGKAMRTSPTNIGLALVSIICAADLGLEDEQTALSRIDSMLTTVEKMEKWNGNLFNWYSTTDASPLYPRSVSFVDSGNLVACLIALEAALEEKQTPKSMALAQRVRTLSEQMTLAPFYDPSRKLFRLGYDAQHEKFENSHYDLLASEARLASYIAIARGETNIRHWMRLGRPIGALGRRRGLLSWSGTMFEYMMPSLFLPAFPGSLLYESQYFALYCQKKRFSSYPYGVSESCFFAFDEQMNYQYKAHGVQAAGLKRGLDREAVIAPYAAWLTIDTEPQEAMKNLRSFEALDASGKWGFYEALDFTHLRIPKGVQYMPVRCFMAHHVGMSLIAAANALSDGIWKKRFMSSPLMSAHESLLKEQMPVGAPLETIHSAPHRERRTNTAATMDLLCQNMQDSRTPSGIMLTGGPIRVFTTRLGIERIICSGNELISFSTENVGREGGIRFFIKLDQKLISLTPTPDISPEMHYNVRFTPSYVQYITQSDDFTASLRVSISAGDKSVRFSISIENRTGKEVSGQFIIAFQPVLDTQAAYTGHPAFSKLFLDSHFDKNSGGLSISRRTRSGAVKMHAALISDREAVYESSRERALGRAGYSHLIVSPQKNSTDSGAPEPYAAAFASFSTVSGTSASQIFAIGCGENSDDAFTAAKNALSCADGMESHRMYEIIEALGMDNAQVSTAFELYSRALYFSPCCDDKKRALSSLDEDKRFLWRWGISGDYPMILLDDPGEEAAQRYLQAHMFLFLCGAYCDLILITPQAGYLRGGYLPVLDIMRQWGGETLLSQRAGVHLIDGASLTQKERTAFIALCDLMPEKNIAQDLYRPFKPLPQPPHTDAGRAQVSCRIEDGTAVFDSLPGLVWSHPLANENFGYLACDSGAGFMWYKNSRENRINKWCNDPLALEGPEDIELITEKGRKSLFARDGSVEISFTPGAAHWSGKIDDMNYCLTAFVHPYINARVFTVTIHGANTEKASIIWHTDLIMGEDPPARRTVVTNYDTAGSVIHAVNQACVRFAPYEFIACAFPHAKNFTCDAFSFHAGVLDGQYGAGYEPCAALETELMKVGDVFRAIIIVGCGENKQQIDEIVSLCSPDAAEKAFSETQEYWRTMCSDISIETPDRRIDRLVNSFLPYQTIAGRMFARTSMYQSSGAYGFRDQLQDAANLMFLPPNELRRAVARSQILRSGSHQYREGDVQHWWHPDGEEKIHSRGVRTKITDDLLFLPYAALIYAKKTGDKNIFDEPLPFLEGKPLENGEHERLETALISSDTVSLWQHCVLAMELVMKRGCGEHGLALIGGGDWNDAMNETGINGTGESVWLSFFAAIVFFLMADEAFNRCSADTVLKWRSFAEKLSEAAFDAWDSDHFLRGYHDDGSPIGSYSSDSCHIDAIAQAFSAFTPSVSVPAPVAQHRLERTKKALITAKDRLFDGNIVKLFDPPFTVSSRQNPGYIKGYTPGIRENGGQYTHGAIWLAMALLRTGFTDEGTSMLGALAPSYRQGYLAEPYYIAADVSACPELYGRSGWTIYTGAAGWYLRAVTDELLGLHFTPGRLDIKPSMPSSWNGFRVRYLADGVNLTINIRKGSANTITLDSISVDHIPWPLQQGVHEADVVIKN